MKKRFIIASLSLILLTSLVLAVDTTSFVRNCSDDSDCRVVGMSAPYCSVNSLCTNYAIGKCINPNSSQSYCNTSSATQCSACSNGCQNNACLQEVNNSRLSCRDTDNGLNYYTRGRTTNLSQVFDDRCLNEQILEEGYCNGSSTEIQNYNCPASSYCEDGVCVHVNEGNVSGNISSNISACEEGSKPFYYYDFWGGRHFRCLKDYRTEGGLLGPQKFFVRENPTFGAYIVSESEIDMSNNRTFLKITDSNRTVYFPRPYISDSFINNDAKVEYRIRADLKNVSLREPIRVDFQLTNIMGQVVQGYRENISSISAEGIKCKKVLDSINPEEGLNIFFLSNGYNNSEFGEFDGKVVQIVQQELFPSAPFGEFANRTNVFSLHNNYTFAYSTTSASGKIQCDKYCIISLIETSCGFPFSDNDVAVVFTSTKIENFTYAGGAAGFDHFLTLASPNGPALPHEFAHAFAYFADEYLINVYYDSYSPNLDTPGCPKWCSGNLNKSSSCYVFYESWKNCIDPYLANWQSHLNELSSCYYNISNNISQHLGYPLKDCNLGLNCLNGTGCYVGGGIMSMFRSMQGDIMTGLYIDRYKFGPYSSDYLRKRIIASFQTSGVSSSNILNQQPTTTESINKNVSQSADLKESGYLRQCDGCNLNGSCVALGYRKDNEYCSSSGAFINQRGADVICENNFECTSNVCINSQCVSQDLLQKILSWFSRLFGG